MIKPSNDLFCPLNSPKPTYSNIDMKLTRATKQQILPCVKLEPENIWWYSSLREKKPLKWLSYDPICQFSLS